MAVLMLSKVWFLLIAFVVVVVGSPTTDLLESVDCLLRDCERCFPNADRNMAENLIVRLQVTIDSVRGLLDSLDRGEAGNTERIRVLESLVLELRTLLSRWELLAIVATSYTSIYPIRGFPTVSPRSGGVGRPRYEISLPQLEFLRNTMRFTLSQITGMLLVSRTTLWRRVQNLESFANRYTTISDAELDELIREIRRGFPNSGISTMLGHLRVRSSLVRIDPVGQSLRWFNTIGRRVYSVREPNSLWHIDGLHCLIRWRFVIHGGIDGFSRLIVYLSCSTNSLATTVHALFVAAVERNEWPSRVRSDKGSENVDVAASMLRHRGLNRGSVA